MQMAYLGDDTKKYPREVQKGEKETRKKIGVGNWVLIILMNQQDIQPVQLTILGR